MLIRSCFLFVWFCSPTLLQSTGTIFKVIQFHSYFQHEKTWNDLLSGTELFHASCSHRSSSARSIVSANIQSAGSRCLDLLFRCLLLMPAKNDLQRSTTNAMAWPRTGAWPHGVTNDDRWLSAALTSSFLRPLIQGITIIILLSDFTCQWAGGAGSLGSLGPWLARCPGDRGARPGHMAGPVSGIRDELAWRFEVERQNATRKVVAEHPKDLDGVGLIYALITTDLAFLMLHGFVKKSDNTAKWPIQYKLFSVWIYMRLRRLLPEVTPTMSTQHSEKQPECC